MRELNIISKSVIRNVYFTTMLPLMLERILPKVGLELEDKTEFEKPQLAPLQYTLCKAFTAFGIQVRSYCD